jgi:predicted  nucleic acid-binding Zn-ribbon protein
MKDAVDLLNERIAGLEAEIARLREALGVLAKTPRMANTLEIAWESVADMQREARRALQQSGDTAGWNDE